MKYRVQKIEQNYNQICHEIKANKARSCKLQLYKYKYSLFQYMQTWHYVTHKQMHANIPGTTS